MKLTSNDKSTSSIDRIIDTQYEKPDWQDLEESLLPGAHIAVISPFHLSYRTACSVEDAGFEIRDSLVWLNVNRILIIILARKTLDGTIAENILKHGCGGINIDACRISSNEIITTHSRGNRTAPPKHVGQKTVEESGRKSPQNRPEFVGNPRTGRWPANLLHDGSYEVTSMFPQTHPPGNKNVSKPYDSVNYGGDRPFDISRQRKDKGTAARFFYTAKDKDTLIKYIRKLIT